MSMDPLQEQLSKLRLIKSNNPSSSAREVNSASPQNVSATSPSSSSSVATANRIPSQNRKGIDTRNICLPENEVSSKKVGPAVPPKPNKKINFQLPEVPQSMVVKQTCEPLYSKRLQSDSVKRMQLIKNSTSMPKRPVVDAATQDSTSGPAIPLLQRKQPSYSYHNIYTNNKVTLDNPAILDQQLEALEHHKKQLQKKGLLQNKIVPKLSSASFSNDGSSGDIASFPAKTSSYMYSDIKANKILSKESNSSSCAAPIRRNHVNVYSNMMNHHQENENIPSLAVTTAKNKLPTSTGRSFIYSNINYENDVDDLPPSPPPPLEMDTVVNLTDHLDFNNECNVNDEEDILPPPSPVSSSYSELRRATDIYPKLPSYVTNAQANIKATTNSILHNPIQQEEIRFSTQPRQTYMNMAYGNDQPYTSYESPSSQGSSAYESIYEPINPRLTSHLSSRSNYLSCPSYVNSPHVSEVEGVETGVVNPNTSLIIDAHLDAMSCNDVVSGHSQKEAEVEALTDLLVHSMDPLNDVDSFGICVACNERVIGENSGCTAMDQVYHIDCFTCSQCQINLQGKPFYALDGKPYCEVDYLNTLEKCSVCMKPILERILRATGKPYHPQCFTCVVCGNSLDGIPFTVDATNHNYCIADFHKKFAPRCCVCKLPIMPEHGQEETVRVVALDRSFHFECYKCEDCGLLLSSEAEGRGCYPLDDHVLCKSCNAKRVQMLTNRMTTDL